MSIQLVLEQAVEQFIQKQTLISSLFQQLIDLTLEDQTQLRAFPFPSDPKEVLPASQSPVPCLPTQAQLEARVMTQLEFLAANYGEFEQFCQTQLRLHNQIGVNLWRFWLPLALHLVQQRQRFDRPYIQGILGVQGTGKTTLNRVLGWILGRLGHRTLGLSLDDFYSTHAERLKLREQDPRLIWRGPPGTHDVPLGITTLDYLRGSLPNRIVLVPRFDKSCWNGSGDRTAPEEVCGVDIVLFEGWFVGMRPIDPERFNHAPAPICTPEDQAFARICNQRLQAYLPLWERLDDLLILYSSDYRFSKGWRRQAEQEMKVQGKSGMGDQEVEAFVDYFWRSLHPELFLKPLIQGQGEASIIVEINANHEIQLITYNDEADLPQTTPSFNR
jgi:D-glycerate 3-kinase